jgi:predicted small lipoprotein YifL
MTSSARTIALVSLLALAACGRGDTPEAPPGAVERTAEALERNEAAELNRTARRIDDEAEARADDSKQRIEAIEKERGSGN